MPNLMAAQPNIGSALCCERSVIPFLVPRRKARLTPAAGVPCSNDANVRERKTWTQSEFCTSQNSAREQEPQKCIYSVPAQETAKQCKVWLTSVERYRCSSEAKMQNRLHLMGCPKPANRSQPLVGRSSSYCEDMRRRCRCLTFFPMVDICRSCEDIALSLIHISEPTRPY